MKVDGVVVQTSQHLKWWGRRICTQLMICSVLALRRPTLANDQHWIKGVVIGHPINELQHARKGGCARPCERLAGVAVRFRFLDYKVDSSCSTKALKLRGFR